MKVGRLILICLLCSFASEAQIHHQYTAIKAGKLIDVVSGTVLSNQTILIDSNRIVEVGPNVKVPEDAKVIDLSNQTVLPGLIDCHTHLYSDPTVNYYEGIFRTTDADYAIQSVVHAERTLMAGFTTIRDVGSYALVDVATKNAIEKGMIPGPRMLVSVTMISATGGHGDYTGFSPYVKFDLPEHMSGIADGIDGVREQVRWNVKYGADWIKFAASAGVLSEEESVGAPQYSQDEMNAIVDEAARWGRKTCAHAHGAEAIKMAVKAGVASIEHGSLLDDEGIQLMKQHGIYLVADVYNDEYIREEYAKAGYPQKMIEKEKLVGQAQRDNFRKAVKAGVKIAFGTDAGVYPHGWNGKQFRFMIQYGCTPMQAVQAATINAADLLGWKDRIGSIEKGKLADIIAITGDPLSDASLYEKVSFVMKEGKVYKQ